MTNIINTRVISLTPTVTRHTHHYVGVFLGVPKPPLPPPPRISRFHPIVLFNVRARSGIFFSLEIRPQIFFGSRF